MFDTQARAVLLREIGSRIAELEKVRDLTSFADASLLSEVRYAVKHIQVHNATVIKRLTSALRKKAPAPGFKTTARTTLTGGQLRDTGTGKDKAVRVCGADDVEV